MNPIFGAGPSLSLRLFFALVLSVIAMVVDTRTESSTQIRSFLITLVSPIQYLASLPESAIDGLATYLTSKKSLLDENQKLRKLQLLQNQKLQRYEMLKAENGKLRALLKTNLRVDSRIQVAEIISVASHPFAHNVVIDKGSSNDVFVGQPVLDDLGVVGQITSVGNTTSRIILLTDQTHAIPIRILRNDIRGILSGTGNLNRMELSNLPHNTDVKVGDKLITSGLGGVFPDGYPVAEIVEISPDVSKPFMKVIAQPVAQVDRLKHVLLLWQDANTTGAVSEESLNRD